MFPETELQAHRDLCVKLHGDMRALIEKATAEKRGLTAEENTSFEAMDKKYEEEKKALEKKERSNQRETELKAKPALDTRRAGREGAPVIIPGNGGGASEEDRALERRAFDSWLRQRPEMWDEEVRTAIQARIAALPPEIRALGLTGAAGGFTVPQAFMTELERAMKSYSGILQACRVVPTQGGATMPWPTVNDTGNIGALLAEGSAAVDTADPTFAAVTFSAYVYTSKIVRVANQLLQDTAFPLENELASMLGERIGRILNNHGTVGTGSSQPKGIVTAMSGGLIVTAASATAIAFNDLVNLMHNVDPAYRARPAVGWMMHDLILKAIKKLVDGQSRPLWLSGIAMKEPDTILGKPYFINQDMDNAITTTKKTILFGDFSKYVVRKVANPIMARLNERYAEYFQTGFVMFDRWDSQLVDAGTGPVSLLQQA